MKEGRSARRSRHHLSPIPKRRRSDYVLPLWIPGAGVVRGAAYDAVIALCADTDHVTQIRISDQVAPHGIIDQPSKGATDDDEATRPGRFGLHESSLRRRAKRSFCPRWTGFVPWSRLIALIEPHYPKPGKGRRPIALDTMLRVHFMQQWFAYSDPAMEEALHDIPLLRRFAGLDAAVEGMPDETTILKFRHLLERHGLATAMLDEINALLGERGLILRHGTMVDATLVAAPTSTKNSRANAIRR